MSVHALPPDPSSWPKDPFQLLGVPPGVSPRDLRRAYLHLVRSYKPEHAPEQFRRIREAYESAQHYNHFFQGFSPTEEPSEEGEGEQGDVTEPETGIEPEPESGTEPPFETFRRPIKAETDPIPRATDFWAEACRGEIEAGDAYRALVEQDSRSRGLEEDFLKLYWLLVAAPEVDPDRSPSEWLIKGWHTCGRSAWRLRELLRREVAAHPAAALVENFANLLRPGNHTEVVLAVAEWRWRAARQLERWGVIAGDLKGLRPWVLRIDDGAWARLLIKAAGNLVWADGDDRTQVPALTREIVALGHHQLDLSEELFQIEYAQSVVSGLRRIATRTRLEWVGELYRLMSLSWEDEGPEFRSRFSAHLRQIALRPLPSLSHLDQVFAEAPAVLGRLSELLDEASNRRLRESTLPPPAEIHAVIEEFLVLPHRWWDYRTFRPALLAFCLRERFAPEIFVNAVADREEYVIKGSQHLSQIVSDDWPLRHVYRACDLDANAPGGA